MSNSTQEEIAADEAADALLEQVQEIIKAGVDDCLTSQEIIGNVRIALRLAAQSPEPVARIAATSDGDLAIYAPGHNVVIARFARGGASGFHNGDWLYTATPRSASDGALRWRHKKRGSTYTEVGRGTMQVSGAIILQDDDPVVVYRADIDGSLWGRPVAEFEDGRFEALSASEATKSDGGVEGHTITDEMIAEWRSHRGEGMISAVGEYTPSEFWLVLDELARLRGLRS